MFRYLLFTSPTCVPCKRMKPLIYQEAITADVVVNDVDVTQEPDYAAAWKVSSVPTLIAAEAGFELGRLTGLKSQADLVAFFEETK
ncbi:thioredoxin family protein [Streptomyces sp. BI20]|uniref:thioredoxin family protein n=1 Tax=Streptomyces sp. BI20 TaxID=3403460 RepID=UPI003C70D826